MTTIAFLNLPWWEFAPIPNDPDKKYLRRGVRAGSRWPFTSIAHAPPGSANVRVGDYLPFPYFLASAAAYVKQRCPEFNVVLRDSIARYESLPEFSQWWVDARPSHVVIETGTPCWPHDLKLIRSLKQSNPKLVIAVAGPATRELVKDVEPGLVDAWLIGEYDKLAMRFAQGERGVLEFSPLSREELKSVPFPLFDEAVAHNYADACPSFAGNSHPHPELTVWASRGCVFRCQFCSWPATMTNEDPTGTGKRTIRYYDIAWIEGFIRERMSVAAKNGKPLQSVRFDGDLENSSDKHTRAICAVMRRIGLPWSMMCRADTSSPAVWEEMKRSGCFGVKIGFESASDRIVNQVVGKKLDLKKAEETCRFLRSMGMDVHTTWLINSPSETAEERKLTLDTIRRFYVEQVHTSHQLSGSATLDGTPLANSTITDPDFVRDGNGQRLVESLMATQ